MQVLAFFTNEGVPETGLTPTVRIRDISDNSLVVTDAAASEVGDGWYKYDFVAYDSDKEYVIRFDGGATLVDSDRYTSGTNDSFVDDIADGVWSEPTSGHSASGSFGLLNRQIAGLVHNNISIDSTTYDGNDNLISGRVRIYSESGSVGTDNNVISTYIITAIGAGQGKILSWKQVEV